VAFASPSIASAQPAAAAQFTETTAAPPAPETDDTVWTLGLNGALNYGNARSLQIGATTHFMIRRDVHMFTLDLQFTYGAASLRDAMTQQFGPWNANAQNLNGSIRYDLWLDADDTLFAVVRGRNDPFAGLDFRFQGQFGWGRNIFAEHEGQHRIWFEVGGDVTYDDRYPNPLCRTGPMGVTIDPATCRGSDTMSYLVPGDELQPSARLFLGYDNHMNAEWTYLTGIEGLIDLRGDPHWRNLRLTWRNTLTVNLGSGLAANVQFNFLYDGEPVPGFQEIDTQTMIGITYTMM
jgi:hypothetical protein